MSLVEMSSTKNVYLMLKIPLIQNSYIVFHLHVFSRNVGSTYSFNEFKQFHARKNSVGAKQSSVCQFYSTSASVDNEGSKAFFKVHLAFTIFTYFERCINMSHIPILLPILNIKHIQYVQDYLDIWSQNIFAT